MARTFNVYDTENGRVVSVIKRVANAAKLAAAELTSTSAAVTVTSTADLWPGMLLIGKGITAGTTVASVDTATAFTMSAAATASGSGLFIIALSYLPYKADGTLDARNVNLEHYRDIFDDTVVAGAQSNVLNENNQVAYTGVEKTFKAVLTPTNPGEVISIPTGNTLGPLAYIDVFTEEPVFSLSDHIAHEPPREQTQVCSFVHFILEDGTLLPVLRLPTYDIVPVS